MSITKALKSISKQISRQTDAQSKPSPTPEHEIKGNRSDRRGVWVSAIAAFLTLWAVWLAVQANRTSQATLAYAMFKDSMNDLRQVTIDTANAKESRANRKSIDSSLAIANKNADALIEQAKISAKSYAVYKSFADAANKSVIISDSSAKFFRQSVMLQTRAMIVLDSIVYIIMRPDTNITAYAYFRNIGKTAAYDVQIEITSRLSASENYVNTSWFNEPFERNEVIVIGAHQEHHAFLEGFKMQPIDSAKYVDGEISLFWLVKINYKDVYNIYHRTNSFLYKNIDRKTNIFCTKFNEIE